MYVYYVAYAYSGPNGTGFGAIDAIASAPFTTPANIADVQKKISANIRQPGVIIINWKLLSGPATGLQETEI